jgi:hypothetical protein
MEPDCLLPAARHQTFGGELEIAFADEGDCFYGCLPLRSVRRYLRFLYPFVTTQVRRTSSAERRWLMLNVGLKD